MCIQIRFYVMDHLMGKTIMILTIVAVFLFGTIGAAPDAYSASKVTICHNGDTKEFPEAAVSSHLSHGDTEGACPDEIVSTSQGSNGFGASNSNSQGSNGFSASNFNELPKVVVGGELIPLDTTMVLVAGTQYTASWMIPVIVSGIGIAIVIARKF